MIIELISSYPKTSIILIAFLISFFISLVNYFVMDKEKMCEIKCRQKQMQEKIKHHQSKGEHEQAMKIQTEMLSTMGETFKHSFKPMLITMIPIIVVFGLIKNAYSATEIAGTWFWWYLVAAIVASIIFRKLLKLP